MITEQVHAGDSYKKIEKVITILITDFTLIKDSPAYKNRYQFRSEEGSVFSDTMEIVVLELPKIPKESDQSALYNWLQFFRSKSEEEYMQVALQNVNIGKAVALLKEFSEDEQTRMIAEAHEKLRRDTEALQETRFLEGLVKGERKGEKRGLKRGRKEGIAEGRAEGLSEGRVEVANTVVDFLRKGWSLEQIEAYLNTVGCR